MSEITDLGFHFYCYCRGEIDRNVHASVASLVDDYEPRSTSAPPHLEDRWAAQLVMVLGA